MDDGFDLSTPIDKRDLLACPAQQRRLPSPTAQTKANDQVRPIVEEPKMAVQSTLNMSLMVSGTQMLEPADERLRKQMDATTKFLRGYGGGAIMRGKVLGHHQAIESGLHVPTSPEMLYVTTVPTFGKPLTV